MHYIMLLCFAQAVADNAHTVNLRFTPTREAAA
jgi:hypothetical protein